MREYFSPISALSSALLNKLTKNERRSPMETDVVYYQAPELSGNG
jgi:hypothetical protein